MKTFKGVILPAMIILVSATSSWASKPARCPSVTAIQGSEVTRVERNETLDRYTVYWNNKFDTSQPWSFRVDNIKSNSADEAARMAKGSLDSLIFAYGPMEIESHLWVCGYRSDDIYITEAITADEDNEYNLRKLGS